LEKYKPDALKVAVGTIFHNKAAEVDRLGNSLSHMGIDYWFLIGGEFQKPGDGHHHYNELDTKTWDVICHHEDIQRENGKQRIELRMEVMDGATEFMKRMKYVDMCREYGCNALFIVDSDEYAYENEEWGFERNWEKFRRWFYTSLERHPTHSVYSIRFIHNEYLGFDFHPRCWGYPEKMRYVQNSHYKFGNPEIDDVTDVLFTHQPTYGTIEGISLKHDHNLRSDEDMKNRRYYQDYLVKYEQFLERPDLTDGNPMMARRMALREMAPFEDNCMCFKCFKMKGIDVKTIIDPRPRDKREKDPYVTGIPL
jgi:hypothetical protein